MTAEQLIGLLAPLLRELPVGVAVLTATNDLVPLNPPARQLVQRHGPALRRLVAEHRPAGEVRGEAVFGPGTSHELRVRIAPAQAHGGHFVVLEPAVHDDRLAALAQVTGTIAHELANPLAAARSSLDSLQHALGDVEHAVVRPTLPRPPPSAFAGQFRELEALVGQARAGLERIGSVVGVLHGMVREREPAPPPTPEPAELPASGHEDFAALAPASAPPARPAARPATQGGSPVLVVDSEVEIRAALDRVLRRQGYAVVEATSGEAALSALRGRPFHAIVTELRMPGMGGPAFIRECLRQFPDVPVVVLSTQADRQAVIELLRLGVSDLVSKPWHEAELVAAVERALARRKPGGAESAFVAPAGGRPTGEALAAPTGAEGEGGEGGAIVAEDAASARTPALARVLARLRNGEIALPTAPQVALEVRRLLGSDEASAARLKELIELDTALAGRLLRIANGSYYAGYGRVTDLRAAIARVGFREVGSLLDAFVAHRFYSVDVPHARAWIASSFRHAFVRAVAMRFLARDLPSPGLAPERAYLAGLFTDVGVPFLLRVLGEVAPETSVADLRAFVREHHGSVGAAIASAWELPTECSDACLRHDIRSGWELAAPVVKLLVAAERICVDLGVGGDPPPVGTVQDIASGLRTSPTVLSSVRTRTSTYVEQHASLFESDTDARASA